MDSLKPGIDRLLVLSALDADFARRLREGPEDVFRDFDLTEEEKDLLRNPDHRLLPLLGRVLSRQPQSLGAAAGARSAAPSWPYPAAARTLPGISLALTVVPCLQMENGKPKGYSFAVWVNSLPEGADPASLPPPPGVALPGRPLAPLHAVIDLSAIEVPDGTGGLQIGLSASLRQSSNIAGSPAPAKPGDSALSEQVRAAVAAVRSASREERYGRLVDLLHALRSTP